MKCIHCNETKELSEFYNSDLKCSNYVCKSCRSKISRHNYTINKNANPDLHREMRKEIYNRWKQKNPKYSWAHTTRDKHKRNGYDVKFTTKELVNFIKDIKVCPYCGTEFDFSVNPNKSLSQRPTLDRIDNEQIMTLKNIQVLCHSCNTMKGQFPHNKFLDKIKLILSRCSYGD